MKVFLYTNVACYYFYGITTLLIENDKLLLTNVKAEFVSIVYFKYSNKKQPE